MKSCFELAASKQITIMIATVSVKRRGKLSNSASARSKTRKEMLMQEKGLQWPDQAKGGEMALRTASHLCERNWKE